MSKIGQKPVQVGSAQVNITEGQVTVKGTKGTISIEIPRGITVAKEDTDLVVKREKETKPLKSMHGLIRSLIFNAVTGVEKPWQKRMEIVGTGFNVKLQGQDLVFKVGYSHPVVFKKVEGITYQVEGNNKVVVSGSDKQLVGQIAHQIKLIRQPDAYKGKGIRYEGEHIRIKPGKKAKTG